MRLDTKPQGERLTNLRFPNLEVLELDSEDRRFPGWMVVSPNLKLSLRCAHSNLPDLQQLWMEHSRWSLGFRSNSCPNLQVLRVDSWVGNEHFVTLEARADNVEKGLEIKGIKMKKNLEKLVLPYNRIRPVLMNYFLKKRFPVVDSSLGPEFWEVENWESWFVGEDQSIDLYLGKLSSRHSFSLLPQVDPEEFKPVSSPTSLPSDSTKFIQVLSASHQLSFSTPDLTFFAGLRSNECSSTPPLRSPTIMTTPKTTPV